MKPLNNAPGQRVSPQAANAADYRRSGLNGVTARAGELWLTTTLDVTAVHMPAHLGARVLENLRSRSLAGPVMARMGLHSGPDRWSVFCWENHTPKPDAVHELDYAGVSVCAIGSPLLLPPGYTPLPGEPWWIHPPAAELPGISVVIAAALMAIRPW